MTDAPLIPYEQIRTESWLRLRAAASDPRHPMRVCTVATVDEHDAPDARILLLRGASESLGRLWFHCDRRSHKIEHLRRQPLVCVVTYDHGDGVQLRLRGPVATRLDDSVAEQHWEQTELAVRHAYRLAAPPGSALVQRDPRTDHHRRHLKHQDDLDGRENFAVLEFEPKTIDWLQVSSLGDRRAMLRSARGWEFEPLAP